MDNPEHMILSPLLIASMPDLIETCPDADVFFTRLEQVAKECEARMADGGCEKCDPARYNLCRALWDKICDLSVNGKLHWIVTKGKWVYDDPEVRDTVAQFMKITQANLKTINQPEEYFTLADDLIYKDKQDRYKLR